MTAEGDSTENITGLDSSHSGMKLEQEKVGVKSRSNSNSSNSKDDIYRIHFFAIVMNRDNCNE